MSFTPENDPNGPALDPSQVPIGLKNLSAPERDLAAAHAEIELLRGAGRAADERQIAAAQKVGEPPFGCDTADHLADLLPEARAELERVKEIFRLEAAARDLAEARAERLREALEKILSMHGCTNGGIENGELVPQPCEVCDFIRAVLYPAALSAEKPSAESEILPCGQLRNWLAACDGIQLGGQECHAKGICKIFKSR